MFPLAVMLLLVVVVRDLVGLWESVWWGKSGEGGDRGKISLTIRSRLRVL